MWVSKLSGHRVAVKPIPKSRSDKAWHEVAHASGYESPCQLLAVLVPHFTAPQIAKHLGFHPQTVRSKLAFCGLKARKRNRWKHLTADGVRGQFTAVLRKGCCLIRHIKSEETPRIVKVKPAERKTPA